MRTLPAYLLALAGTSPALAQAPSVVTDIPAVHSLVAQVMGDAGTPTLLLDQGADPHHFQLRPSQVRALSGADVIFWIGPELTPWLDRALHATETEDNAIELLESEGTHIREFSEAHGHHDDHDDHDTAKEHETQEEHADHHDHDGVDPHAWLDPENARNWVNTIALQLSSIDPENAETYAQNAAQTVARIEQVETEIKSLLAPIADQSVLVYHDAYGYFSAHFSINVAGSIAAGDAAKPGAAHLSELRHMVEENNVVCIFPEANSDPAYLTAVSEGTNTRIGAPLDPAGISLARGPDLYSDLLLGLANALHGCLAKAN